MLSIESYYAIYNLRWFNNILSMNIMNHTQGTLLSRIAKRAIEGIYRIFIIGLHYANHKSEGLIDCIVTSDKSA